MLRIILCLCLCVSFCATVISPVQARDTLVSLSDTLVVPTASDEVESCDGWQGDVPSVSFFTESDVKQLVVPAVLIGVGTIGACLHKHNTSVRDFNVDVLESLQPANGHRVYWDEVTPYLPAAAVYGLNMCGIEGKHDLLDRSALLLLSFVVTQTMAQSVKSVAHIERPNGEDFRSFPSGHTATAFMCAEYLRMEYQDKSPWIGVAGYVAAVGTGWMRMYNNKHWLTDVLAGAGVGILGTRLSYWVYPWLRQKISFLVRSNESSCVMPYYDALHGAPSLAFSMRF